MDPAARTEDPGRTNVLLPDVQDEPDARGVVIDEVGIAGLRYPTQFDDGLIQQQVIAEFGLAVRLPAERRGTHMSRMAETVHDHLQTLDPREFPTVLKTAADRLDVEEVSVSAVFPVATLVMAPVTGAEGWQTSDVRLLARLLEVGPVVDTTVLAEVTSLCPCSKAVSDYGAHNQRSVVSLTVRGEGDDPYPLPVSQAIDVIRGLGSSPIYPIIKRPDERALTMHAFDTPSFVEDIVRDLSIACRRLGLRHRVHVRNIESIHSHDAVAIVQA
jgi:GTP cyclohydrolase IB